jgi:hypothetical protein
MVTIRIRWDLYVHMIRTWVYRIWTGEEYEVGANFNSVSFMNKWRLILRQRSECGILHADQYSQDIKKADIVKYQLLK